MNNTRLFVAYALGQSLKSLFENYEIITEDGKIIPFGVEVTS